MHQKYWLYCPITVTCGSTFCKLLLRRYLYMLPFKITSSCICKNHVCYSCLFLHLYSYTCSCLYHPLSILWLCVRVRMAVFICLCVFLILICFYIPSLYAALHLFCFFLPPLRRVPLCWLETSLITHRENLVCFRFRWMVVWVNGWMDKAGRRKDRRKEIFEKLLFVGWQHAHTTAAKRIEQPSMHSG